MSAMRIPAILAVSIVLCAAIAASPATLQTTGSSGPSLGKWEFAGKDSTGVAWTGTLTISELDTNRFNKDKYQAIYSLDLKSAASSKGVEAPGRYDAATRTVSFSTGVSTTLAYTAVLSADGKSLTGKWTESKEDDRNPRAPATVIKTGEWSAKLAK